MAEEKAPTLEESKARLKKSGEYDIYYDFGGNKLRDEMIEKDARADFNKRMQGYLSRTTGSAAKSFRENLPQFSAEQYRNLLPQARDTLDTGLNTIRVGSNNRGMLFSGLREHGEQSLRSDLASMLASQQKNINQESENIATAKEKAAASIGLNNFASNIENADRLFNMRLENAIARRRAISDLGSGIGYGIGAFAARGKGSPNSQNGLLIDEEEFFTRRPDLLGTGGFNG